MGRIRELSSSTGPLLLEADTLVGRAPHCGVPLVDHRVSNEHAALRWRNKAWAVRDLGSTNGTWLNDKLISSGSDHPLQVGDELAFGAKELLWRFEEDGVPQPMLCRLDGEMRCELSDGVIVIPNVERSTASVFRGADGSWTLEADDRVRSIAPGSVLEIGGATWRFSCPTQWQATVKTRSLRLVQESTLYFEVSSDEEHVALSVATADGRLAMGNSSSYYLLLTLARIRDQERGSVAPSEAGWVHRESLITMLRTGEQQLNVWVHRIRARFSSKDFLDYASIVERRDGTGQLRIGVERNVIQAA